MNRFFTGHTYNPDGTVQFKAGKTRVGKAVDGAIKIFTVAVCALFNDLMFFNCLSSEISEPVENVGYYCGCGSARRTSFGSYPNVSTVLQFLLLC